MINFELYLIPVILFHAEFNAFSEYQSFHLFKLLKQII